MKERLLDRLPVAAFRRHGESLLWALFGGAVAAAIGWLIIIPLTR